MSLMACLATIEVCLRIWGPRYYRPCNQTARYHSNPRGYLDLLGTDGDQPVYGLKWDALYWDVGPLSMRVHDEVRSREDVLATFARHYAIMGLGDSFLAGAGVRYEDTCLRRLEKRLAEQGHPLAVGNFSVNGNHLEQICRTYADRRLEDPSPLVIYGFVLNDFGLPNIDQIVGSDYIDQNNGDYGYNAWRSGLASVNLIAHLVETIRLDRVTRKAYLDAFRGENAKKHFQMLADLNQQIKADGGTLVIMLFPLLCEFDDYPFQEIHDTIHDFCRREGIALLDLLPAYSRYDARELWVHPTDHHPNELAHKLAADELYAFLTSKGLLEHLSE